MEGKLSFVNKNHSEFYSALKVKVDDYFRQNSISPYANAFMVFKIIFFLTGLIGAYVALVFGGFSLPITYLLWILLGLFTAFAAVNIGHDAIHGAISPNNTINAVLGYIFDLAGANSYLWNITHNIQHHTFTNIEGHDGDIESVPTVRLSPHRKRLKINRFQHIYTFILYGFTSLIWVFYKDYRGFAKTNFGKSVQRKHPVGELFILIIFKAIYYALFLAIPLLLMDFLWWQVLIGFFLMHFVEGICLAIIIQLAHLVENVEFPLPDTNGNISDSWAVHQMRTTADYARNNWLVRFLFGGLNFHIEHHLFQSVCHVHHQPLSVIVKQTAEEHHVPYHDFTTLGSALASHIRFLKKRGRE
jgi:linoleoyl-CoA desaturase